VYVARIGERRVAHRVLWEHLRERDHLEGPGADGRIRLKWIFQEMYSEHKLA